MHAKPRGAAAELSGIQESGWLLATSSKKLNRPSCLPPNPLSQSGTSGTSLKSGTSAIFTIVWSVSLVFSPSIKCPLSIRKYTITLISII